MEESEYNLVNEEARRIAIQSRMTWGDYVFWGICTGVVVAIIIFAGVFFGAVNASLDAEVNLQTTRFVIRLVEQFVKDHRRWPASWQELEAVKPPEHHQSEQLAAMLGPWPGCAKEVEKRVSIDFHPDVEKIVREDPLAFDAIKPTGIHYHYQEYGDVDALQRALQLRRSEPDK